MQRFLDLFISINYSTCFRRFLCPTSGAQNCTYSVSYCQTNTAACCHRGWDGTKFHLIRNSSSIGLTMPETVCTVLCSWRRLEEPPEICREIYRNKQIEKALHLIGCTLEIYFRCTDYERQTYLYNFHICIHICVFFLGSHRVSKHTKSSPTPSYLSVLLLLICFVSEWYRARTQVRHLAMCRSFELQSKILDFCLSSLTNTLFTWTFPY